MPIASMLWMLTLGEADEMSFDAGASRTATGACRRDHLGVHLRIEWTGGAPRCRLCGAEVPLVEAGSAGEAPCASCLGKLPTFPAPPWLRNELPTALQVYGVEYVFDAAALDSSARRWWIVFQGTPARKAVAHDVLILEETLALSKRMPVKRESGAYMLPLLICLALIAFATYIVTNQLREYEEDPILSE